MDPCLQNEALNGSPPPEYERRPKLTASLLGYSTSNPFSWMEEEAIEILQTSHDFNAIRLFCKFVPTLEPDFAATLLSERWKGFLEALSKVLCRREGVQEPPCDSLQSTAEAILGILKRRLLSPAPEWNGYWILSDLNSSTDVSTIAEKLDAQIQQTFSRIAFEDWLAWICGYQNDVVQSFLDTVFNFRNALVENVQQQHTTIEKFELLRKAVPFQQPLPHWIITTAMAFDTSSEPSEALQLFLEPSKRQVENRSSGIVSVVRNLSILDTRYKSHIAFATDVKWPNPFPTDFNLWESIQRDTAWDLAESNTASVAPLYARLSLAEVLDDSEYLKAIQRQSSDFPIDIEACLNIDQFLAVYFIELAENLLHLQNVHSAAAIGLALERWRYQPPQNAKTLRVWDIINPKNNYAGCRKYMAEAPCLPLLSLYVAAVRHSKNASTARVALFQYVGYFGRQEKEVEQDVGKEVVREGTSKF